MVAVTSARTGWRLAAGARRERAWTLGAVAVLVAGVGLRVALYGGGIGARSAAVVMALVTICTWAAASVLAGPRGAFAASAGVVMLANLAALPPRGEPAFDDRQAFFRTDQAISADVAAPPGAGSPVLTLLIEPVFAEAQPAFELAGEVGDTALNWQCPFRRGLQQVALPIPPAAVRPATLKVSLHLTGAPNRESEYLLVYASARRGGWLIEAVDASSLAPDTVRCKAV